jgi:hypothetical protein
MRPCLGFFLAIEMSYKWHERPRRRVHFRLIGSAAPLRACRLTSTRRRRESQVMSLTFSDGRD